MTADSVALGDFELLPGLYLLGSAEKRVTVYGQQVRAHNLAWALSQNGEAAKASRIAVVGGGIGGLTAAACILGLFKDAKVVLLERSHDLVPLQQGCDSRWLHPRIYDWPNVEATSPTCRLPVLDWKYGRASDVASSVIRLFAQYVEGASSRLEIFLGTEELRIDADERQILWRGKPGDLGSGHVRAGAATRKQEKFDAIIVAVGFGIERSRYGCPSYWRNEKLGQPRLDGSVQTFVLSGYGDGALIDLCRLSIERFRQDTILRELFDAELPKAEARLADLQSNLARVNAEDRGSTMYDDLVKELGSGVLSGPLDRLRRRLRKDTRVSMHLAGKSHQNTELGDVLQAPTSFLNRLAFFLLYQAEAFVPRFDDLDDLIRDHAGPPDTIICRHGTATADHVLSLFTDTSELGTRLETMRSDQRQSSIPAWPPGQIPPRAK